MQFAERVPVPGRLRHGGAGTLTTPSAASIERAQPPLSSTHCACGGGCPRCSGALLAAPLRASMEARLGTSLTEVRVHTDAQAAKAAAAANANAFTIGEDVYFGAGKFAPHTQIGAARLAHELVHVEQQRRGLRGAEQSDQGGAEREARDLGRAAASGHRVTVRAAAPLAMQREGADSAAGPQLHLDPEIERLMLQHYIRWWVGSALVLGQAPTALPPPLGGGEAGADSADSGPTAVPTPGGLFVPPLLPTLPPLPLLPDFFAPLPPDPHWIEPDAGALFSPFGERGAPVGTGDSAAVMSIYRRNAAIASGLPDLRAMAPSIIRPLIPATWRRDIAGALTGAAVGASLKHDYTTPIEVADRAWEGMTGASTTVIPLPAISFDLF